MGKKDSQAAIKPGKGPRLGQFTVTKAGALARPRSIQLYGPPGTGKSTYAATICRVPGFNKVTLLDFDSGSAGIADDHPEIEVITFKRGDIATFEKWFIQYLQDDCRDDDALIVDTVTKAQRWKKKATVIKGSPDTRGQWGEVGDWTIDLCEELQAMRALGIGIFHTIIGNSMKGGEGKEEFIRNLPALQGAAASQVGASADIVGFCDTEDMDEDDEDYDDDSPLLYTVQVQPSDTTITKNRFRLPPVLNASSGLPRLYEMIAERSNKKEK